MKRCPECRRDYFDDTLLYCLDDGSALLEGPASASENQTAILSPEINEALTIKLGRKESDQVELPVSSRKSSKRLVTTILATSGISVALIVALIGLGYFGFDGKRYDSIAVLPFLNESGSADVDYLSDGITESLINTLTRVPSLSIKPRSSTFRYKGRESDIKVIGSELDVRAVLIGRLVQRNDDITLYLSLIDTTNENQIWGEKYSRKMANLVTLQSEVASDLLKKLQNLQRDGEVIRLSGDRTQNSEAYRLYLRGRYLWDQRTPESIEAAQEAYRSAIELDPNYGLAYAGLADTYLFANRRGMDRRESMITAKDVALKAIELDNSLAEAHTTIGFIKANFEFDPKGAQESFLHALELDPNYAIAHQFYSGILIQTGETEKGLEEARRAVELEPYSLAMGWSLGRCLFHARRYQEAEVQLRDTLKLGPDNLLTRSTLVDVYAQMGKFDKAQEILDGTKNLSEEQRNLRKAYVLALADRPIDARNLLTSTLKSGESDEWLLARAYAAIGDNDRAIKWLDRAYDERVFQMFFLAVAPEFDKIRNDPRFRDLLKKLNLPELNG